MSRKLMVGNRNAITEDSNIVVRYTYSGDVFFPTFNDGYTYHRYEEGITDGVKTITIYNTDKVYPTYCSFKGNTELRSILVYRLSSISDSNMEFSFENCTELTYADFSMTDVSMVHSLTSCFKGCSKLSTLDVSTWELSSLDTWWYPVDNVFSNCTSLVSNPFLQMRDISRFVNINMVSLSSVPSVIDFKYRELTYCKSISLPPQTTKLLGLSPSESMSISFRDCDVLDEVKNVWFDSSVAFNYWYYGGGKFPMSVTFIGEILAPPSEDIAYNLTYSNGFGKMDSSSLTSFMEHLKDYTGDTQKKLLLSANQLSELTSEQIAIANSKNWIIQI